MGQLSNNNNQFPIYAYFKTVKLMPQIMPDPTIFADGVEKPNWEYINKNPDIMHGSNLDKLMCESRKKR